MKHIKLSIIIPVYNRPEELRELLESLTLQTNSDFEIWIIEDGSNRTSETVVAYFKNKLKLHYVFQENTGPAYARNHGMRLADGTYFVFFDSDCIIPPHYIENVLKELNENYVDAYGGYDAAHASFSAIQKAINYSMTSILTTGGIRGGKIVVDKFQPRSFNMGISRAVFDKTKGFGRIFPGEDPDLTLRIWKAGFKTRLLHDAFVYHKRRISFKQFSKQVYGFGKVRPMLNYFHDGYTKLTFWFPTVFFLGSLLAFALFAVGILGSFYFFKIPFLLLMFYLLCIFLHSTYLNKSLKIGFLSILTTVIQFYSYGWGFLKAQFKINVLKNSPEKAFPENFKNIE